MSIVQPATLDVKPVRPNLMMNAAIGLFLACAGSVGLAILLESRAARRTDATVVSHAVYGNGTVHDAVLARNGSPLLGS